jgi:DNA-directed RNA polymerase subunit RPC12/RpoP
MKTKCPKCSKQIKAPDDWAGRMVKCPGCRTVITLPSEAPAVSSDDLGFDLGSLGALENEGQAVISAERGKPMSLKEAQAAAGQQAVAEKPKAADPRIRKCPRCGQKVKTDDLYSDVMCRHCGAGIPAAKTQQEGPTAKYTDGLGERVSSKVSFYSGFTSAVLYPIPGIQHISIAMGIAEAAIALPLGGILAFLGAANLNDAAEKADFGWVGMFLTIAFAIEGAYFGAVAYAVLIDTIRATKAGNEQPPSLTWNPISMGGAMGGYMALLLIYLIALVAMFAFKGVPFPTTGEDWSNVLADPGTIIFIAILTFSVPMNMIGLASSHAMDGLNPVKFGKSIGRTFGHYCFLFLLSVMALGFYAGIMYAVMSWAGPAIMKVTESGIADGISSLIGGMVAWGVVVGVGFYFAYSIGRLLGLFNRTYRESLAFE